VSDFTTAPAERPRFAGAVTARLPADRLFGDEEAEPSDDFSLAFARPAVEVLEEIERRKLTGWGRRHDRP
jgi:hypothetical protein